MNKIIFVAALGVGVYGVKKYLQSYTNRKRFFDILDDTVSFVKKSVKRGFEEDIEADFSGEIREIFYAFESMKSKSFEIFFELQKALAEIRNIKTNISLLRMTPIKDDYLNFNTTNENLQLLREFTCLLSQANKLVNFTAINEIVSLNDDFNYLNEKQIQFLIELINLNNVVVSAISCESLASDGKEVNEQIKRAFQRLKIKLA